jgi:pyridoxine 4-dehydrogenase
MTKGGHFRTADGGFAVDNSPARLRQDVEDSLRALRTNRIDLCLLHPADDESVPIADSVAELVRLRDEGKVAEIGVSNVRVDQLRAALDVAPIVAVQNQYSPLSTAWDPVSREECTAVIAECEARGLVYLAYSPLKTAAQVTNTPGQLHGPEARPMPPPATVTTRGSSPSACWCAGRSGPCWGRSPRRAARRGSWRPAARGHARDRRPRTPPRRRR